MLMDKIVLGVIGSLSFITAVLAFAVFRNLTRKDDKISPLDIVRYAINLGSILIPFAVVFVPPAENLLWDLSLYSVLILMCIRPLRDLLPKLRMSRFMPLRKNLGILSSIIVVSFGLLPYITFGPSFIFEYFSLAYWSFENSIFWAHIGQITGFILLITSNTLSMRLLKRNWKKVQKLSYVYFFSGAWYVFASFGKTAGLIAIALVFGLTFVAFIKKQIIKNNVPLLEDKWDKRLGAVVALTFILGLIVIALVFINQRSQTVELEQLSEDYINKELAIGQYYEIIQRVTLDNKEIELEIEFLKNQTEKGQ